MNKYHIIWNLTPLKSELFCRLCRQPPPSLKTSASVVRSQLYASVAITAPQDSFRLASH